MLATSSTRLFHQRRVHRELIIGGHDVPRGRYPYFVSIDKNNGVIVSGALIAPDLVLTAGHVAMDHMDNLTLVMGAWSVHDVEKEVIPVKKWILHPAWNQTEPAFFAHDFLIIQLDGKSTQTPITMNRSPVIPTKNEKVVMMGLGWTQATQLSPAKIVQETTLTVISNKACESAEDPSRSLTYHNKIVPTMMCTTSPPNKTRDGCAWDSGAPLILKGKTADEDILVALGSTGVECADKVFPGIQARVSADLEWIDSQVCALSMDPPSDFNCTHQQYKQNQTTPMSKALYASSPLDLSESKGVPFWIGGVVVCVLVLFGAMALRRFVRRSQRVDYTPL